MDLDQLFQIDVIRLEKVEWIKSYIWTKPKAFNKNNIHTE